MKLILQESRWTVQLIYMLRFFVGACLSNAAGFLGWRTLVGMASWACVCIAIYVLNGISDLTGDRVNRSSRPIASGALDVKVAWQTVACLVLFGLMAAATVSIRLAIAFVVMFALGWAYSFGSRPLKNSVAGLVFSGSSLGMLTYLAGWLAAGGGTFAADEIVVGIGLSLWMGLVGTATKDLKDVPGDRLAGRRTLPILLGARRARIVAGLIAVGYGLVFLLVVRAIAADVTPLAGSVLVGACGVAIIAWRSTRPAASRNAYHAYLITQCAANLSALV